MKKLIKLLSLSICIVIMGVFFVGCSKHNTQEINFYNYGENIDDETLKEFEKKFNIKVNMETFDDMEAMYSEEKNTFLQVDQMVETEEEALVLYLKLIMT